MNWAQGARDGTTKLCENAAQFVVESLRDHESIILRCTGYYQGGKEYLDSDIAPFLHDLMTAAETVPLPYVGDAGARLLVSGLTLRIKNPILLELLQL